MFSSSQVAALCGLHCLNTLLQGPCFGEFDLAQVRCAAPHRLSATLLVVVLALAGRRVTGTADAASPADQSTLSLDVQIAHKLDAAERALMLRSGADSEDYQRFMREESGNVASDGNFSLQVCSLHSGARASMLASSLTLVLTAGCACRCSARRWMSGA